MGSDSWQDPNNTRQDNWLNLVMKFLFTVVGLMAASFLFAQDHWNVMHGSQLLLNASKEDTSKNKITLKRKELKSGYLFLTFTQQDKNLDGWQRTVSVEDIDGNTLLQKNSSTIKLSDKVLKEWFKTKTSVRIYTWKLPTDPKMKALVRVRRLHLCTIVFK